MYKGQKEGIIFLSSKRLFYNRSIYSNLVNAKRQVIIKT